MEESLKQNRKATSVVTPIFHARCLINDSLPVPQSSSLAAPLVVPFVRTLSLLLFVPLKVSLIFWRPGPAAEVSGVPTLDTAVVDWPSAAEEPRSSKSAKSGCFSVCFLSSATHVACKANDTSQQAS